VTLTNGIKYSCLVFSQLINYITRNNAIKELLYNLVQVSYNVFLKTNTVRYLFAMRIMTGGKTPNDRRYDDVVNVSS